MIKKDSKGRFAVSTWSEEKIRTLTEMYPDQFNKDIAAVLNLSVDAVQLKAGKLGLKKSREFKRKQGDILITSGAEHRYPKGHIPANKGKKQTEYMTAEAIERTKETRFKKGQVSCNALADWEEVVDRDGYIYVKIPELRKKTLKHRLVWEQTHGKIAKGYNVQFLDGNRQNCALENLYIISRKEQINQNSIQRYPNEIKTAMHRIGKINKLIQGKND